MDAEAEDALVSYLKIDTTNPPGNETAGATFLRDLLVKNGIAAQLVGDDPRRQSSLRAARVGEERQSAPAAQPHRRRSRRCVGLDESAVQRRAQGRVSLGTRRARYASRSTVAELMSLIELKRRGVKLRRDVVFLAVPDEELGGLRGAKKLLDDRADLFTNVGFVLNEGGSNETALDRILFWGIEVDQKVPLWLRVTATSAGGHGAAPVADGGATAKLIRALGGIDAIETPYRLTVSVARTSAIAARERKDGRGQRLRASARAARRRGDRARPAAGLSLAAARHDRDHASRRGECGEHDPFARDRRGRHSIASRLEHRMRCWRA